MRVSGRGASETVLERRHGLMEPPIRENGEKTKLMDKENSFIQTVMCMKANGPTIKSMGMECTHMPTVPSTKATGKTISSTALEWSHGPIPLTTRECIALDESMVWALTSGMTALNILVIGTKIRYLELESTHGSMADVTRVNGKRTIWRVLASTTGVMVECTSGST